MADLRERDLILGIKKISKRMLAVAYRFTNNREDAEDVVQEALISLHIMNWERLEEVENDLDSYLAGIVRNKAIAHFKKNKRYLRKSLRKLTPLIRLLKWN